MLTSLLLVESKNARESDFDLVQKKSLEPLLVSELRQM